ncbi:MAG: efflux RND transporter permease subunit, partial [Chloroflexota bacterium]
MHILTRFSLKRASIVIMLAVFVIASGLYSMGQLKSELLPNIDLPQVSVVTVYPGAAPDDVRKDVTEPIEKALAGTANLKNITSTSNDSVSFVSAEYEYGTNMEKTQQSVEDQVNSVTLPTQAQKPTVGRFSFQDIPVLAYTVNTSEGGDDALANLRRSLEDKVVPELKAITGVNSVTVAGGGTKEVRITFSEKKLSDNNLTSSAIISTLQANNISFPTGDVTNAGQSIPVRVTNQFTTVDDLKNVMVRAATKGGTTGAQPQGQGQPPAQNTPAPTRPAVKLSDVADVALVNAGGDSISRSNGKPSMAVIVYKTQNANTVQVADDVAAKMNDLTTLVPGTQKEVLFDQSTFIKDSLDGLIREGLLGAVLAIIVILIFLASVKSTVVTAVSIPLSVLIALTAFNIFGLTLNIMSLAGLAVAIGRVVDDSIVVLENIYRHHYQRGEPLRVAAFNGTKEVATAITASTITTVCVFLPLGFIAGLVSEFFRPFALAVSISLLASLIVALTVIPVLASFFLRSKNAVKALHAAEQEEHDTWLQRLYTPTIRFALRSRLTKLGVLAIALVLFVGSMALTGFIGTTFINFGSDKVLQATLTMKPGADLDSTDKASQAIEEEIRQHPNVLNYQSNIGGGSASGFSATPGDASKANLTITLDKSADLHTEAEWLRSTIESKQAALNIEDAKVTQGSGTGFNSSAFSVIVSGNNYDSVLKTSDDLLTGLKGVPNLVNVTSNAARAKPEIRVKVDPAKALEHGSTTIQIATQIRGLLTSQKVTQITIGDATYDVQAVYDTTTLNDVDAIKNTKVGVTNPVPLSEIADVSTVNGPVSVTRVNQERSITVSGTINSDSTSGVTKQAQTVIDGLSLENGTKVSLGGVTAQQSEAFGQLFVALIVAIFLVYLVMVLTFGSLSTPFIILFSLPLAAIGSIAALFITGRPLGISALIGVLMLVGIVVTNAIVLLELVEQLKARGFSTTEALIRGGKTRVRPILMTAIATLLALMPLVLGFSEGSIIASELGTVVVGGLFTSTFLTLIVVPVAYSLLDGLRNKLGGGPKPAEVDDMQDEDGPVQARPE